MRRLGQGSGSGWRSWRGSAVGLGVGLLASALGPPVASAQPRLPQTSDEAELPLPDIDAIERGAKAKASASFGPSRESAARPGGDEPPAADEAPAEGAVRRLKAPPPPSLSGRAGVY